MKKSHSILIFIFSFFITVSIFGQQQNLAQYVNPFVGTDYHGHTYPGAIVPFGMIQPGPDTRLDGWDGCSAYHYSDNIIYGFSHTHLSGTGCSDYGDLLLMPFTGKPSVINKEYASSFSHQNETASPGYYAVLLNKDKVKVELTASKRVAMHRYTFSDGGNKSKGVILDLKHRDKVIFSKIQYDSKKNMIVGIRESSAWNDHQKLSFSILFSQPIKKIEYYVNGILIDVENEIAGKDCKAVIYFADDLKEVVLKVAISGIVSDMEGAIHNQSEISDFNFDKVKADAQKMWNDELNKIVVETEDTELKEVFYTALYHAFTSPYLFSDIDGRYCGMDGSIHQSKGHEVYTVFSLWDTYRALHPLLSLIDRKRTGDFLYTFMKHYEQGGMLPVWELAGFETWCMIGYHSVSVIYDAFMKGIGDIDNKKLLEAMVSSAKLDKLGRSEYAKFGFIPGDKEHEDVSKTLEYAYDDWCIAQFAKELGNKEIYNEFIQRCQFYKNILDSDGFMHPKENGGFIFPFDPTEINNHITEGNSWQYSTYVPHDINNYIKLLGGNSLAEAFFDTLFNTSSIMSGRRQSDVTGLIGQYAHGNEPSHHAAYLYNYVGVPWKTQELTRKIMRELYTSQPDGLCGNEDCGQMSAWYVFSAMGFYPVCPGSNQYIIGSPIFDKVTINLENGEKFIIICNEQNAENVYIKSAKLNGEKYSKSYFSYDDFKNGGTLEFEMINIPNDQWGNKEENRPSSFVSPSITIVPNIQSTQRSFMDKTEVTISLFSPSKMDNSNFQYPAQTDVIYYTIDCSEPTVHSIKYTKPIIINKTTLLKAVAYNPITGYSKVVESKFQQLQIDKSIILKSQYSPQYTGGGDNALIDNLRGGDDFRLGGWQGYQGQDFEAVVDIKSIQDIKEVGIGVLQDIKSWIWYPSSVTIEISEDNTNFFPYGTIVNPYPTDDYTPTIDEFIIKKGAKARYFRIKAKSFGQIPDWHLGAGYDSWIFIDEIIIN